jgi:protein-tyrosine-phosphatase
MKLLFVCSGNICRSAMAAEYLCHRAVRKGLSHLVVDSAGTLGIEDAPASNDAIRTLQEAGLDLRGHRSRGLTDSAVHSSDLVIGMTHDHLEHVAARHPGGKEQRWLLRAFEAGAQPRRSAPDLADPIGEPIEIYREQFGLIRTCVDHLVLYLRHLDPCAGDD